ncbi:response regulator transcription factor [Natranaerobius trueperi]|uniref:Stage 0 sporulation protein A homolog n=1 Tax=Natranaerobius trueperi TaxID=759412 RepID=A0A226BYI1_9FIRM|nr:response regulator transcription factor [Natranaerobius trueperi]OWZ83832.1 DNA-binding response regulator [Natranaerobius trueperi]
MSHKILLVEDDCNIAKLIVYELKKEGFQVCHVADGKSAINKVLAEYFDLVILDLMIPKVDGAEVCKSIRTNISHRYMPVIIVSAKDDDIDKIIGLELGADDYITKPFNKRELTARVKAHLRREQLLELINGDKAYKSSDHTNNETIQVGSLVMNLNKHQAFIDNKKLQLTSKEFELLRFLALSPGQVFTRNELLENIWKTKYRDQKTVDVHIRYIRQKIADTGWDQQLIETVRGIGYRVIDDTKE